jgi:hypothetical protein
MGPIRTIPADQLGTQQRQREPQVAAHAESDNGAHAHRLIVEQQPQVAAGALAIEVRVRVVRPEVPTEVGHDRAEHFEVGQQFRPLDVAA